MTAHATAARSLPIVRVSSSFVCFLPRLFNNNEKNEKFRVVNAIPLDVTEKCREPEGIAPTGSQRCGRS